MTTKAKKDTTNRRKQLTRKEYTKLRRSAYEYVVVQGLDQKEVARMLNLSEPTLSKWANDGKEGPWKELREARQLCSSTDADNTKKLLSLLAKQRLNLENLIQAAAQAADSEEETRLRKQASSLSDEMSKVNKTLLSLDNKVYTLGVFIDIMDEIFNALRIHDETLWEKTIDFQSTLIRKKTTQIG